MAQVFDFTDYRKFLSDSLDELGQTQRGTRSRLAEALGCQPSYLTQVLKGTCHVSLEQAEKTSRFFGLTDDQTEYFLVLVSIGRAGTEDLKEVLKRQARRLQAQHRTLNHRIKTKNELSPEAKSTYYGHWYYAAIAIALTVPKFQTKDALSSHFKLPLAKVSEILEFLVSSRLAVHQSGRYKAGDAWIHLGEQSDLVTKDHINWRLKTIQSLESKTPLDLHYSSVVSLSREDFLVIKAKLIQAIEEARGIIKDSKEEFVGSLLVDFFEV
jgi:uncharacterized protein (TIGR02147 family)